MRPSIMDYKLHSRPQREATWSAFVRFSALLINYNPIRSSFLQIYSYIPPLSPFSKGEYLALFPFKGEVHIFHCSSGEFTNKFVAHPDDLPANNLLSMPLTNFSLIILSEIRGW